MKIIIEQDGVKRQLADKPFAMCLDRETAEAIIARLQAEFGGETSVFNYGWVDIYVPPVRAINEPPSPWAS